MARVMLDSPISKQECFKKSQSLDGQRFKKHKNMFVCFLFVCRTVGKRKTEPALSAHDLSELTEVRYKDL